MVGRNLLGSSLSETEQLKAEFRAALQGIREEFDDHLESINENTGEIQTNYEYLCRLDAKIEKLNDKVDQLQHWMSRITGLPVEEDEVGKIQLTPEEKQIFLVVYTTSRERPVTYADIGKALHMSEFLVRSYVTSLVEKGIPVCKQYIRNTAYLSLDSRFKELQTKHNVLSISQMTVDAFQ
jgi:Fic family protein